MEESILYDQGFNWSRESDFQMTSRIICWAGFQHSLTLNFRVSVQRVSSEFSSLRPLCVLCVSAVK